MKRQFVLRTLATITVLAGGGVPASADFVFNNFSSISALSLNGDATRVGSVLRVARGADRVKHGGSVWYGQRQRLIDGFDATFVFNMNGPGGLGPGADGLAFVVQDSPDGLLACGGLGSGLGYASIRQSLAVEFDTWTWGAPGEVDVDHISVQTRGDEGNRHEDEYAIPPAPVLLPFELDDGADHTARVRYLPGTMQVYVDDLNTPRLVVPVELTNIEGDRILDVDGKAWVGFTAATGGGYQNHDLVAWQFHTIPEPPTAALLLVGLLAAAAHRWRVRKHTAAEKRLP